MKLTKRTSSPGTWRDGERFEVVPEGTVAALEQECEHQREIINGSDHLSRIAALEQAAKDAEYVAKQRHNQAKLNR